MESRTRKVPRSHVTSPHQTGREGGWEEEEGTIAPPQALLSKKEFQQQTSPHAAPPALWLCPCSANSRWHAEPSTHTASSARMQGSLLLS